MDYTPQNGFLTDKEAPRLTEPSLALKILTVAQEHIAKGLPAYPVRASEVGLAIPGPTDPPVAVPLPDNVIPFQKRGPR